MNPKISVLIPMYNRKHYISEAVDSVLNQSFQDFELVIRDDGSTDGSYDFVREKYAKFIGGGGQDKACPQQKKSWRRVHYKISCL